jgi:hypothetical protein
VNSTRRRKLIELGAEELADTLLELSEQHDGAADRIVRKLTAHQS